MNSLKVAMVDAILTLLGRGWSQRRVARELGVDRKTIRRHLRLLAKRQNPPNPTAGSDAPSGAEFETSENTPKATAVVAKSRPGPASSCEEHRELILAKLGKGLSGQRIWQDLKKDHGFAGSYESVKRFIRRLAAQTPLPFRRIEVAPGEEAQVDFGRGAPVKTDGKKGRRPHVFRIVLSHSRKGYTEARWRQTTMDFLCALENAFSYFGGVPQAIVIDNLKAAVKYADWYDSELHPIIEEFARHYGCVVLPTRPKTPRHKGKVERGIDYVQENGLKGLTFAGLNEENAHLWQWEETVADLRIHGTTRKQVKRHFEEVERPALRPLPASRFAYFREERRTVQHDGHVTVEKAYYMAPPEYRGRRVWVRWDGRVVRILNQDLKEIALHAKVPPGKFSTPPEFIHPKKISGIEQGADRLLAKAALIGPSAGRWAEHHITTRGIQSLRALVGLCALTGKHTSAAVDDACRRALAHGATRLRDVRALIGKSEEQQEFEFMSEHPIIRNPVEYGLIVKTSFADGTGKIVPVAAPRRRPASGEAGAEGLR